MKSNWKVALIALGGVVAVALMCVLEYTAHRIGLLQWKSK